MQDRTYIAELGRDSWVTNNGYNGFQIVHSAYTHPCLGSYPTEERALEVLGDIFEHYKNGKAAYVMPSK